MGESPRDIIAQEKILCCTALFVDKDTTTATQEE